MEQQNKKSKRNTLIYLGIAGVVMLIAILIAYVGWSSGSGKKQKNKHKTTKQKDKRKTTKQKNKRKTTEQKNDTKSTAKEDLYALELENKQKEIRKDFSSVLIFPEHFKDFDCIKFMKQVNEKAGTKDIKLQDEAKGDPSKALLKKCETEKKGFEATLKAREAAFKKEEVALNKKVASIPSVEKLKKAINAAQEAKSTAEKAANTNEVKKQKGKLAILEQELAYAKATKRSKNIKNSKKATAQEKEEAAQQVDKAKDGLKTPQYKAAKAALGAHKAHAAFLQDAVHTIKLLIEKVEDVS